MKEIFNLKNLAYFTIMAMPLYIFRFSILGVPTNVFEILAIVSISLFFIRVVGSKIKLEGSKTYLMPIIMVLAGLLISALYNDAHQSGFGIIKSWFIIPIVFSWISLQLSEDRKDILKAMHGSAFLVACLSLLYFIAGETTFDGRLQAFYNSPNFLAMFLAPSIMIGVFLLKENKKIYSMTLSVMLVSLYLTQSYASWIAVFIAMILLLFLKKDLLKRNFILILMLIFILFFSLQKGTDKLNRFTNMEERSSAASRMMIWSSAMKIGLDNPAIGIGPGNFQNKYLEYQKYFPPYLEWAVPQPHNLFLAFWLQAGVLGIVGFLWILFLWFRKFIQKNEKQKEDYICLGIIIYIMVHGLFDTTYFKNDLAIIFWLIIFYYEKHLSQGDRCGEYFNRKCKTKA
ncbi:MAG: O-antigen polymerase [uncultured bacterium]|nr:MAG: O-antigen polymerase [uncultured bacterium]